MLTISIVSYNSPTLDECISTLLKVTKNIPCEIFVVDNNSTIHKPQQDKYLQVHFIFNTKNVGFGRANNQVIEMAQDDFILVMNPDLLLEKNTIPELINYLLRNKHVKIVAPKLLNSNGSVQLSCRKFPTPLTSIGRRLPVLKEKIENEEMEKFNKTTTGKIDWASGACLLLRGKQYFDPRYFLYFEDVDLCRTAREVHYVPSAQATHLSQYASRKLSIAFIHHTISMMKYFWKWETTQK